MAGSLNKVQIIGNLGKDPEIRHSQDGTKIATFSVATSETWNDKNSGERKEKTEWHRVVVFNDKLADVVEKYVRKGSKLYVEGQLQTRKWTDTANVERYSTEIVLQKFRGEITMLDSKGSGAGEGYDNSSSFEAPQTHLRAVASGSAQAAPQDDLNDDIPF